MTDYEGNAVVYCEGALRTTNGKTAHGLMRRSHRYRIPGVIDSTCAGKSAADVLPDIRTSIPIFASVEDAASHALSSNVPITHFVIGLAPDGGRLPDRARRDVKDALCRRLHVVSGLHDFLSEDSEIAALAAENHVTVTDIRKPPHRNNLHFFSGKIDRVTSLRVAVLGTDSAVGKRTTAWMIVDAFNAAAMPAELIGTGQTAWLQGARYSVVFDSLVNDFVSGEIEHAVWSAWSEKKPDIIVIEGQGSLMNPAYPGGFEILAAGRPHAIVLQHAPRRVEYDGFPGYPIHPLKKQIAVIEMLSCRPVAAVAVNSENIPRSEVDAVCKTVSADAGLIACDPLVHGVGPLVDALMPFVPNTSASQSV